MLACFFKVRAWLKDQHHTCEAAVKFVSINNPPTLRRVIQEGAPIFEAFENHKMVEIPKDNGRQVQLRKLLGFLSITFGDQSVRTRDTKQIAGLGAVAAYATLDAQFGQGNMAAMVGKNHRQRCRTAFDILQLENCRGVFYAGIRCVLAGGGRQCLLGHDAPSSQNA